MKSVINKFLKDQSNRIVKNGFVSHNDNLFEVREISRYSNDRYDEILICRKISDNDFIEFGNRESGNIKLSNSKLIEKDKTALLLETSEKNILVWCSMMFNIDKNIKSIDKAIAFLTNDQISDIRNYTNLHVLSYEVRLLNVDQEIIKTSNNKRNDNFKSVFFDMREWAQFPIKDGHFFGYIEYELITR